MDILFADVLDKIFSNYGLDILHEGDKLCAIVGDLAPSMKKEQKVLKRMSQEKILEEVYREIAAENNSDKKNSFRIRRLLVEAGFSDEWVEIALSAFKLESQNTIKIVIDNSRNATKTRNAGKKYFAKNQAKQAFPSLKGAFPSIGDEVMIPAGYTVIGRHAFNVDLHALKTQRIIIPETIEEIQDSGLADIEVSDYIEIPSTVTVIGNYLPFKLGRYAYIKCDPESYAYEYCRKNGLSNSVDGAPRRPSDRKVSLADAQNVEINKGIINSDLGKLLFITDARSVEKGAFRDRNDIEILVIGRDVKYIKQNAFRGCNNLKYIYFSDSVKSIASNAFTNCVSLKFIYFNEKSDWLKELDTFFASLNGNKEDTFSISESAFEGCRDLSLISGGSEVGHYFKTKGIPFIQNNDDSEDEYLAARKKLMGDDLKYLEYLEITSFILSKIKEI